MKTTIESSTQSQRAAESKPAPSAEPIHYELSMTIGDPLENPTEHFALTGEQYAALKTHLNNLTEKPAPRQPQPFEERRLALQSRADEIQRVRDLDLSWIDLDYLETLDNEPRRLQKRSGPNSVLSILHEYKFAEQIGKGVTVEDVEGRLEELRENMADSLERLSSSPIATRGRRRPMRSKKVPVPTKVESRAAISPTPRPEIPEWVRETHADLRTDLAGRRQRL